MFQRFLHFLKFNNAVPIALSFLLLSSVAGVFAASPQVRSQVASSVVSSEEEVVSVDNTYIVGKNFIMWVPKIEIIEVTEDEENYYVKYVMSTIDVVDFVWQDLTKNMEMTVSKQALDGRDLGLYVSRQMKEVFDQELSYLKRVQDIEKKNGPQQKVAVKKYKGLVGRFFDPEKAVFPGYKAIVEEKGPPNTKREDPVPIRPQRELINPEDQREEAPQSETESPVQDVTPKQGEKDPVEDELISPDTENAPKEDDSDIGSGEGDTSQTSDAESPNIQLLGDNPVYVEQGSTYTELGVVVTDNSNEVIEYTTHGLDAIDFNVPGTYEIFYLAADNSGNTAETKRTVIVSEETESETSADTDSPESEEETGQTESEPDETQELVPEPQEDTEEEEAPQIISEPETVQTPPQEPAL